MSDVIDDMLARYDPKNSVERDNDMREVIQEIMLYGLSCAGFFDNAAFTGGTALRIFHGLDRFSEDLDFTLLEKDDGFDFTPYMDALRRCLNAYGMDFSVEDKAKMDGANIKKAMAEGNKKSLLLLLFFPGCADPVNPREKTRIKMEVNVNPPAGAACEIVTRTLPDVFEARVLDMPSLFACKIDAVLSRQRENRYLNQFKGRDLFDYVFFLQKGTPLNMELLRNSLIASGHLGAGDEFTKDILRRMLDEKFREINFDWALRDVRMFTRDRASFDKWDADMFISMTDGFLK